VFAGRLYGPGISLTTGAQMPDIKTPETINRTSEAELRELTSQGLNWVQISEKLGIPAHRLRMVGSCLGISTGRAFNRTPGLDFAELVSLLEAGETFTKVAAKCGVERSCLRAAFKRKGLPTTCRAAIRAKSAQGGV